MDNENEQFSELLCFEDQDIPYEGEYKEDKNKDTFEIAFEQALESKDLGLMMSAVLSGLKWSALINYQTEINLLPKDKLQEFNSFVDLVQIEETKQFLLGEEVGEGLN